MGKQVIYIAVGMLTPIAIFFLLLYLYTDDPFWLGGLVLGVGSFLGAIILIKVNLGRQMAYTNKAYDGKPAEIVEKINGVLVDAGIQFERKGPSVMEQGPPTLETFVIEDDDMTIEIVDRLGFGVVVMIGPMDEYNKSTVERFQEIIDSAKEGEVSLWGNR